MKTIALIAFSILLPIFSCSFKALAQEDVPAPRRIGLMIEQDGLVGKLNNDQNYTMGLGIYFPQNDVGKLILRGINLFRKDGKKYNFIQNSMGIANATFTPEYLGNNKIDSLNYMLNDRPFAGINYLSTVLTYGNDDTGNSFSTFGFNLGIIGTDFSQSMQSYIHRKHWFGSTRPIPVGWANQISETKPVPTFLLYMRNNKLLLGKLSSEDDKNNKGYFQLSQMYEGKFGYYVGASYGLNMRLGLLDKKNWANDFFPLGESSGIIPVENSANSTSEGKVPAVSLPVRNTRRASDEIFFLGGIKPNVWLYNAFLMGQFNDDDFHTLSWKQMKKVTVDFNIGIGGQKRVCGNEAISAAVTFSVRSPEFKTSDDKFTRWHKWAGIQIYYVY